MNHVKSYGWPGSSVECRPNPGLSAGDGFIEMRGDRPAPHWVATLPEGATIGVWVEPEDTREFNHFTGQAKLDLFSEQEQRDIYTAAYVSGDIDVLLFCKRLDIADYLTYSDPSVEQGLSLLVHKGLLTEARKAAVVQTMTQPVYNTN